MFFSFRIRITNKNTSNHDRCLHSRSEKSRYSRRKNEKNYCDKSIFRVRSSLFHRNNLTIRLRNGFSVIRKTGLKLTRIWFSPWVALLILLFRAWYRGLCIETSRGRNPIFSCTRWESCPNSVTQLVYASLLYSCTFIPP